MIALSNFLIAFVLSFAGSIPPGTINLTVVQLGLENKVKTAIRFAFTAALIEYPYAWIAVKFERLISSSPVITDNIQIIGIIMLIGLGLVNVLPSKNITPKYLKRFSNSGYRRGVFQGILNPLAIPYWIAVTAYLRGQNWIELSTTVRLHAYLAGVFAGALLLLVALAYLSKSVMSQMSQYPFMRKVPGFLLISLGLYSLGEYLLH